MAKAAIVRARSFRRDMPLAERRLWNRLKAHRFAEIHARRQVPCGPFFADFAIPSLRIIIEVDGATHASETEMAYDARRNEWFAANGWRVLRFTNEDVYRRIENVLDTILAHVEGRA